MRHGLPARRPLTASITTLPPRDRGDESGPPQMVILAAGQGQRLRPDPLATPKPLTPVLGCTLLERAVRAGLEVGVRDFIVVVGYRAEALRSSIRYLGAVMGARIRPAYNPDWELGNGVSVLAAEPYIAGRFFLSMCDHVFAPDLLQRLLHHDDGRRPLALAVDHQWDDLDDIDEATKVRLLGRRIMAIGKRIDRWHAVDTGVFLCRPPLFDALREAQAAGDDSLSGGVGVLARRGEAMAVPADGLFWHDIDTAADLQAVRERMLARRSSRAAFPDYADDVEYVEDEPALVSAGDD